MLGDGSRRNLYELSYKELLEEGAEVSHLHPNVLALRSFRVSFCKDCLKLNPEPYMLTTSVWQQAVPVPGAQCFLCLNCVQERLQRSLTLDDFTSAMVNDEIRFGFRMGRRYKEE